MKRLSRWEPVKMHPLIFGWWLIGVGLLAVCLYAWIVPTSDADEIREIATAEVQPLLQSCYDQQKDCLYCVDSLQTVISELRGE